MKIYDKIIIGGGASGMVAAIESARAKKTVLLIEKMEKLGKKLLATGNGKCNMSNLYWKEKCYHSDQMEFVCKIMNRFTPKDTISFFRELGLLTIEKNGYIYPLSEQALSVVEVLRDKLDSLGAEVHTGEAVKTLKKERKFFELETEYSRYRAREVVLACGGKASEKLGSDGSGYKLARSLGHRIIPVLPALTALRSKNSKLKLAAGVRKDVRLYLYINGRKIIAQRGELQITDYGISGIPVFQISRFAAKALSEKKTVTVRIDFFPDWSKEKLYKELWQLRQFAMEKSLEKLLRGLLNQKLVYAILTEKGFPLSKTCDRITKDLILKLVLSLKDFPVEICKVNDFSKAQVCAGGVDLREIKENFESKLVRGLYLVGEVLDVDGICGGYNLQWAFASGYLSSHAELK